MNKSIIIRNDGKLRLNVEGKRTKRKKKEEKVEGPGNHTTYLDGNLSKCCLLYSDWSSACLDSMGFCQTMEWLRKKRAWMRFPMQMAMDEGGYRFLAYRFLAYRFLA